MNSIMGSPVLWKIKSEPGRFQYRLPLADGSVRSFKCSNKREGERLAKAFLVERSAKTQEQVAAGIASPGLSVRSHIEARWKRLQVSKAATSKAGTESALNCHVYKDEVFCNLDYTKIGPPDIIAFLGRIKGSTSTKARLLKLVRSFFRDMKENPIWISPDEKPAKGKKRKVISFPPEDELRLLAYNKHDPLWNPFLLVALNSGMRPAELFDLKWDRVWWATSELRVDSTADTVDSTVVFKRADPKKGTLGTKNETSERTIPISPTTLAALQVLFRAANQSLYVFPDPEGGPWNRHRFRERFYVMLEAAEIARKGPHSLHHTTACRLLREGSVPDGGERAAGPQTAIYHLGYLFRFDPGGRPGSRCVLRADGLQSAGH